MKKQKRERGERMRIKIEGHEDMVKDIVRAKELLDELGRVVHRLGHIYGEFQEEETASAATETETRD